MPGPHQVRPGRLPAPDQVPSRLLHLGRHPHRHQRHRSPALAEPGYPVAACARAGAAPPDWAALSTVVAAIRAPVMVSVPERMAR